MPTGNHPAHRPWTALWRVTASVLIATIGACSSEVPPAPVAQVARVDPLETMAMVLSQPQPLVAFCVDSEGWFITGPLQYHHASEGRDDVHVTLILNPRAPVQQHRTVSATVVRSGKQWTLLRVEGVEGLSALPALTESPASVRTIKPGDQVSLLHFAITGPDLFPTLVVQTGQVLALEPGNDDDGDAQLNIDIALRNASAGGVLLNEHGEAVGLGLALRDGGYFKYKTDSAAEWIAPHVVALSLKSVQEKLRQNVITLDLPTVAFADRAKPVRFHGVVQPFIRGERADSIEIQLKDLFGRPRTLQVTPDDQGRFAFEAAPSMVNGIDLERHADRETAEDYAVTISGMRVMLSDLLELRAFSATAADGRVLYGTIEGYQVRPLGSFKRDGSLEDLRPIRVRARRNVTIAATASCAGRSFGSGQWTLRCDGVSSRPPPVVPLPGQKPIEIALGGTIEQMTIGGAGRFQIFKLKDQRELVVVDAEQGAIAGRIALDFDAPLIAAGMTKLIVASSGTSVLRRYDLETRALEEEADVELAVEENVIRALALGSASEGPIFVGDGHRLHQILDLQSLKPASLRMKDGKGGGFHIGEGNRVRAAHDGSAFAGCHAFGQSVDLLVLDGRTKRYSHDTGSPGYPVVPAEGGRMLLTGQGIQPMPLRQVNSFQPARVDLQFIPTHDPMIYCAISDEAHPRWPRLTLISAAEMRAIATLPLLSELKGAPLREREGAGERLLYDADSVSLDRRIQFRPGAKQLITVPVSNDRVMIRRFDLEEALRSTGQGFVFVTQMPKATASTLEPYVSRMAAVGSGPITFRPVHVPEGLKVTATGDIVWQPADAVLGHTVGVTIDVECNGAKTTVHFPIEVK